MGKVTKYYWKTLKNPKWRDIPGSWIGRPNITQYNSKNLSV